MFAKAHEISGVSEFHVAVERCANYIVGEDAFPESKAFHCRNDPHKDSTNGLIGQAWCFEALSMASALLGDKKYIAMAIDVYRRHPFERKFGLWRRIEIDGEPMDFDLTFNHQLWFAACSMLLSNADNEIATDVAEFLSMTNKTLLIRKTGRIAHAVPFSAVDSKLKAVLKDIRQALRSNKKIRTHNFLREVGYHQFNLYAFGILHESMPEHPIWKDDRIKRALRFIESDEFLANIGSSQYGYPYNPPGFECAFAISSFETHFEKPHKKMRRWVQSQIDNCIDRKTWLMSRNASDINTCSARIYEAVRLPDMELI